MVIREAEIDDIKQIQVVRNSVKENTLSDPIPCWTGISNRQKIRFGSEQRLIPERSYFTEKPAGMDTIFWICVKIMQVMSKMLGITYQQLNVILFVILHPAITLILYLKYRKYKRLWQEQKTRNY